MRRVWQPHLDERIYLYSPIGLRLVDDFTGDGPITRVKPKLEIRVGADWIAADAKGNVTNGIVSFPGLGRSNDPAGSTARRYRVTLSADVYKPFYEASTEGIEFDVPLYNDRFPPSSIPENTAPALLLPRVSYPFPTHTRILFGRVLDTDENEVANVTVREGQRERVLTEANGSFALPIRQPAENELISVEAMDQRTGREALVQVQLPDALATSLDITIN